MAKGMIGSERNTSGFTNTTCKIMSGATVLDELELSPATLDNVAEIPFSLTAAVTVTTGQTLSLACNAEFGADGVGLHFARLTGIRIG